MYCATCKAEPAVNVVVTRKVLCHVIHCAKYVQPHVVTVQHATRCAKYVSCMCNARIAWKLALITVMHVALIAKCVKIRVKYRTTCHTEVQCTLDCPR